MIDRNMRGAGGTEISVESVDEDVGR